MTHFLPLNFFWQLQNATGYHPGPVAPPCADGASLGCSGKCLSGRKTRRQAKNFFSWLWNLCQLEGNRVNRLSRNLSDHVLNISAAILNYRRLAEVLRKRNIFRPLDFDLAKLGGRSYKQRSRKLDGTKAAI